MGVYVEEYRVTVQEAARRLGVQDQAIRKRIKRGTIRSDKDEDGRVYVYISAYRTEDEYTDRTENEYADRGALIEAKDETIAELRARIDSLERRLDRSDHLIAAALERIPPQLEPPREPQNPAESAAEGQGVGDVPQETEEATERPWWRRWLGG